MKKRCKKCGFAIEIYFLEDGEFLLELAHGDYACDHEWEIIEEENPLTYAEYYKKGEVEAK